VLTRFVDRSRVTIEELRQAIDDDDAAGAALLAHRLKGNSVLVGALRLGAGAGRVYELAVEHRLADARGLVAELGPTLELTATQFNVPVG
jgi:HPt (histidine-containing phosphotransfer) domain-containing protein